VTTGWWGHLRFPHSDESTFPASASQQLRWRDDGEVVPDIEPEEVLGVAELPEANLVETAHPLSDRDTKEERKTHLSLTGPLSLVRSLAITQPRPRRSSPPRCRSAWGSAPWRPLPQWQLRPRQWKGAVSSSVVVVCCDRLPLSLALLLLHPAALHCTSSSSLPYSSLPYSSLPCSSLPCSSLPYSSLLLLLLLLLGPGELPSAHGVRGLRGLRGLRGQQKRSFCRAQPQSGGCSSCVLERSASHRSRVRS